MIDEIRNYIKNKASIDELKSLYEMHSYIKDKLEKKLELKKKEFAFEPGKAYRIMYKSMENIVQLIKVINFFDNDNMLVTEIRATHNGFYHLTEKTMTIANIIFDDVIVTPIDEDIYNEFEIHSNKFIQEYKDNCIEMFNKIKSI